MARPPSAVEKTEGLRDDIQPNVAISYTNRWEVLFASLAYLRLRLKNVILVNVPGGVLEVAAEGEVDDNANRKQRPVLREGCRVKLCDATSHARYKHDSELDVKPLVVDIQIRLCRKNLQRGDKDVVLRLPKQGRVRAAACLQHLFMQAQ